MLKNRKYIGEYRYGGIIIPKGIRAIIDEDLFERVQQRMALNKKAPAKGKAAKEYLLTTKLFCGTCGRLMVGESGKSRTGVMYHYYKCSGAKRHLGCKRKAIRKQWIERAAVLITVQRVLKDDEIDRIAAAIVSLQEREDTTLPAMRFQLAACEKAIDNMLNAIQQGIITASTKERLGAVRNTAPRTQAIDIAGADGKAALHERAGSQLDQPLQVWQRRRPAVSEADHRHVHQFHLCV